MTVLGWTAAQFAVAHAFCRGAYPHAPCGEDLEAARDVQAAWALHWSIAPQPSPYVTLADTAWGDAIMRAGNDGERPIAQRFGRA